MRIIERYHRYFFSLTYSVIIIAAFALPLSAMDSLLLSITLNKEPKGIFIAEMTGDGKILLLESDLKKMGIRNIAAPYEEINGELYIYVESINGAETDFDEENLALEIMVPPDILDRNVIDLYPKRRKDVYYPRDSSAFLNYRLEYFNGTSLERTITLSNELGIRSGDLLFLTDTVYTDTPSDDTLVRLITSLIHDDRKSMKRTVAGDFYSSSGELGSIVNMGGVSYSKLFSIDPYFIQYPLLNISGVTALPSEISLYRDGISMFSRRVSPGEFDIQNISYYDGASDIELVITDIFGREQRIASPYYFTSRLLKEGLHEYSYNFGLLREQFGIESNDYKDLVLTAFHRYGFHNMFTGGFRTEATNDLFNVGAEAAARLGNTGVFQFGMAGSGGNSAYRGFGGFARYQYRNRRFSGNMYTRWQSRDYTTISSMDLSSKTRLTGHIDAGYSAYDIGSFGASFMITTRYDDYERTVLGVSYSKSLTRDSRLFVSVRNIGGTTSGNEVFFGLSYYPWKDHSLSASVQIDEDSDIEAVRLQKAIPSGEGYGYGTLFQRAHFTGGTSYDIFNPYAQYNSPYGTLNGSYTLNRSDAGSRETYRLAAAGGIAFIDDTVGFIRPVHDSFALVKVGDMEGISVLRNNQKIGETNKEGKIFVPELSSFFENQVSIRDSEVPIDYYMPEVLHVISPPYRSGTCIFIELEKVQALSGTLLRESGDSTVPVTFAEIYMEIDEEKVMFFTGAKGDFYFDRSVKARTGEYADPAVTGCTFFGEEKPYRGKAIRSGRYSINTVIEGKEHICSFAVPDSDEMIVEIGDIRCREIQTSDAIDLSVERESTNIALLEEQVPAEPEPVKKVAEVPRAEERPIQAVPVLTGKKSQEQMTIHPNNKATMDLLEIPDYLIVHFPFNDYVPGKESDNVLKDAVSMLQNENAPEFIIEGHTDQIGGRAFNYRLGMVRALFVKKVLESHDISGAHTAPVIGYGKDRLLCTELTDACTKKNRRVVLRFMKGQRVQ